MSPNVFVLLLPITPAVFVGFFTFGLPMPVLPVHAHDAPHERFHRRADDRYAVFLATC